MLKPDYNGGSLLNLMASIINKYGGISDYKELNKLPSKKLVNNKTILFLIDGFGYNTLNYLSKDLLGNFNIEKITSVFPTSTTSAITTINTGEPPLKHCLLSWFQYMKELGLIGIPLSNSTRYYNGINISDEGFEKKYFKGLNSIYSKIKSNSTIITRIDYINSDYTKESIKGVSDILGYKDIEDIPSLLIDALKSDSDYIYVYIDSFDIFSHNFGYNSLESLQVLNNILEEIKRFIFISSDMSYNLLITGDHGQIISENRINLKKFDRLISFLSILPTGDSRHLNIFLKNGFKNDFLAYYKEFMSKYFYIFSFHDVIENNLYGVGNMDKDFKEYFGDYLLIAKENYIIGNFLFNEIEEYSIGEHGGLSSDELYIPLLIKK